MTEFINNNSKDEQLVTFAIQLKKADNENKKVVLTGEITMIKGYKHLMKAIFKQMTHEAQHDSAK